MPLVDLSLFEPLFAEFAGKKIGFIQLHGNVGDALARLSTRRLFRHFEIDFVELVESQLPLGERGPEIDEFAISAQGTMGGDFYSRPYDTRQEVIQSGLPVTILPSSFIDSGEDLSPYRKIFVRERNSLARHPGGILVPDTAMGYIGKIPDRGAEAELGMFLRTDRESAHDPHPLSLGDPVLLCATVDEYFELASRFETIVTDRLHFCIAALLLGRDVTFLPNSYFKNRSFWETWLSELCAWEDSPEGIEYDKASVEREQLHFLAGPPSRMLPWQSKPLRENGWLLEEFSDGLRLVNAEGNRFAKADEVSQTVWRLCDGTLTIDDTVELLASTFDESRPKIARDVQTALSMFHESGALVLQEHPAFSGKFGQESGTDTSPEKPAVLHLHVHEPRMVRGKCKWSATLHGLQKEQNVWFAADTLDRAPGQPLADPFVLVFLMSAMRAGLPIEVSGARVSSGLLYNLAEFQQVWAMWRSSLTPIEIRASEVHAEPSGNGAIVAFSGGVDSCYTVFSALNPEKVDRPPEISAALMVHGFDIPLREAKIFESARYKARTLLDCLDIPLITMETNVREFSPNWVDEHGLMLGGALSLFNEGFNKGVIAATNPYLISLPVGSHFVTDRLMSSDRFLIEHHGAGATRLDKIRKLCEWDMIENNLRICWSGPELDRNCQQCRKCVLAALMFDLCGRIPACLEQALKPEILKDVFYRTKPGRLDLYDMICLVEEAERMDTDRPWLKILRNVISSRG